MTQKQNQKPPNSKLNLIALHTQIRIQRMKDLRGFLFFLSCSYFCWCALSLYPLADNSFGDVWDALWGADQSSGEARGRYLWETDSEDVPGPPGGEHEVWRTTAYFRSGPLSPRQHSGLEPCHSDPKREDYAKLTSTQSDVCDAIVSMAPFTNAPRNLSMNCSL